MRQHPIDLMPASIRSRTLAGVRTGRFIALAVVLLLMLVVTATHSRVSLSGAQENLMATKTLAEAAFATDAKAANLRTTFDQMQTFIDLYQKVASPIQISAVMATVINALPESVTLDQFDVAAGVRTTGRSPRSKGNELKDQAAQRVLTCEISGFAASDDHIAQLVSVLENTPPFRNINLDFSKTKKVNQREAREFRLSFNIDLNRPYVVAYRDGSDDQASQANGEGSGDDRPSSVSAEGSPDAH